MERSSDPENEMRGARGREITPSKRKFEADESPYGTLRFSDLDRIILLSNTDRATPTGRGRVIAPLPYLVPFQLRTPPRDWPARPRAVVDWCSSAGSPGFKEGGGGALPSRAAVPSERLSLSQPCARRLVGTELAASRGLSPPGASRTQQPSASGSRARRARTRAGAVQPRRGHS